MLPPVSAVSTTSAALAQRDVPAVAQQVMATLAAAPDAAIALSQAVNSEVEGKLNMLLLGARERMIDSLFAVVDAVSQSLAMQPEAGESNVGYALRLASAVNELAPSQVASVQQQLDAQGQSAPLALVARALQNPAGTEAAQVVAYMEVVRYKEKDLATKAVVASYGQNGGAEEPEATGAPAATVTASALPVNSVESATAGQSKSPAAAGPATEAAPTLPPASAEPDESASTQRPAVGAPLQQTVAPSPQAAPSTQIASTPAKLPAPTASAAPQAAAPLPEVEASAAETIVTPQPTSTPLPTEPAKLSTAAPPVAMPATKDVLTATATALAGPADAAISTLGNVLRSQANPPAAAAAALARSLTPQAPALSAVASQPANAAAASQPQLQQQAETTGYQPAPVLVPALVEEAVLLPTVAAAMEGEIQPLLQPTPQATAAEEAAPPLSLQPQSLPASEPLLPIVNGQIPPDVQAVLKVVVDRLVSATGVELLQTMAEVEPVAEKVVAQALVADMLDSAELGALPSPDDATLPMRSAQVSQQPAATTTESPVEELVSLVALNRLATESSPIAQAMVQQPLQAQMPLGVPFAIGQYLPVEDAVDENEAPHIDRVDAVDDEEHEAPEGRQERGADEEAADEQPEPHHELHASQDELGVENAIMKASDPEISRQLALPRPAPMEPLAATAFNLYQRMGGWD